MFKRVNREIVKKYKNIFLQSKNVFEATQLTLDLIVKIKNGKFKEATEEEISLAHKEAAAERFDNFMDSKEPIKLITGSVIFLLTTGTGENKKTEEIRGSI